MSPSPAADFDGAVTDEQRARALVGIGQLTVREREILDLMAKAYSSKRAARELGISPRTVEKHRHRVMQKLGAQTAADVVRILGAL